MPISFEIIDDISEIETIATDKSIREIARLRRSYGSGRWRKMKGRATVRLPDGIRPMVSGARIQKLRRFYGEKDGKNELKKNVCCLH